MILIRIWRGSGSCAGTCFGWAMNNGRVLNPTCRRMSEALNEWTTAVWSAASCMCSKAAAAGAIARPNMVLQQRSITALCAGRGAAYGKTFSGSLLGAGDPLPRRWSIPRTSRLTARRQGGKGGAEAGCWPLARRAQHEDTRTRRC